MRLGDGEAGPAAERAVAVAVPADVPGGPPAGWLVVELQPEQARAAMSAQPRKVPAARCLTTTLISPGCLADPAQYHSPRRP
ncbi:MAG: hypothetical protein ACTHPS_24340 [Streptosporangiaceae bacterium]